MDYSFVLDKEKDSQLLIDVYNVLRKSIAQYFKALSFATSFFLDNKLRYTLELSDIRDLGVDITKKEWQDILYRIDVYSGEDGVKVLRGEDINSFVIDNIAFLDYVIICRAELFPGIHDFLYSQIEGSISVARYMLRMARLNPWETPPWFEFHGVTFKHGEDIIIFLNNQPESVSDLKKQIRVSFRKAILELDIIKGQIFDLQSENKSN